LRIEGPKDKTMRVEATVPESQGLAMESVIAELGLSKSQFVTEAISFFVKAIVEVRRGRRLIAIDRKNVPQTECELATPTLTTIEWAMNPVRLNLSEDALLRMQELASNPPKPAARMKAAAARVKRAPAK
jgi:hypothetical protein